MKNVLIRLIAAFCVLFSMANVATAQVRERGDEYFGHMWGGGYGMGYGIFGGFMMALLWLVVIALVVIAVRWWMEQASGKRSSALDILQERLAKGEIDPKEYEERKKALES